MARMERRRTTDLAAFVLILVQPPWYESRAYSGFQLNLLQFYSMRRGVIVQAFFTALPS